MWNKYFVKVTNKLMKKCKKLKTIFEDDVL
jgi:hypothetical protein